jgi:acetoin utilization deacetylase AcuC-like enzyme
MTTLLLTHPDCAEHLVPAGHPERPERLAAIENALADPRFAKLKREQAPLGTTDQARLAHAPDYVDFIEESRPEHGFARLDPDTSMSPKSWDAALRAVGAATRAVDAVIAGEVKNAFCAVRPPGHHAETRRAMGFCLFNNAAIGAIHARKKHGLDRVAVVDFDVHHGNGTQEIFWSEKNLFYGSTHQMPLYPGTGAPTETGVGNVYNAPLAPGSGGEQFRDAVETVILPALDAFRPDLVIVSAGFDAHARDPLANLNLVEPDFAWVTGELLAIAEKHASGRLVSTLEGGYDLQGLAGSVAAHVETMMAA